MQVLGITFSPLSHALNKNAQIANNITMKAPDKFRILILMASAIRNNVWTIL